MPYCYYCGGDGFIAERRKAERRKADPADAAALAREPVLRAFFEKFIRVGCWDFDEPDWGDVQDEAVKAGLLVKIPHPQPCGIECCPCEGEAEYFYYFAWSAAARAAQETTGG